MKNRNQIISSDSFSRRIPAPRQWLQAPEEIAARGFSSYIRSPRLPLPQLPSAHSWIDSAAAASALSDFRDSRRRSSNPGSTAVLSSNRFALSSDLHDHWRFLAASPVASQRLISTPLPMISAIVEFLLRPSIFISLGTYIYKVRMMILKAIGVMEMQNLFMLFKGKVPHQTFQRISPIQLFQLQGRNGFGQLTFLSHESSEHYVILDCGSTGTRVYVYKWTFDQNKGHRNLPIALKSLPEGPQRNPRTQSGRAYHRMETEPGFDKLVHDKYGLRAVLQPLLLWAEKQIPKHAHKDTSLFLYATAGVRRRDWIKLISGMEEAYYGWIALNHHMGLLGSLPAGKTYGSLDLGYGLNDAFDKSVAHLFRKFVGTEAVKLEGSPLTGGKTMSKKKTGIIVELIGAPQWEECHSLARLTVNWSAWSNFSSGIDCELKPCALSDGLPHPRGKFYAMSGDGRVKTPLSPTISGSQQHPFGMGHGLGGSSIHLSESSVLPLVVSHSYSSGSLGQMQFGSGAGSFWPPHRGKTTLSSRRSQSREDLNSSLADAHVVKV
ncbi:GDA1/CD39 (nucleoside phosphatase) family [Musa troglodytarum]|uniref:GDA1/CD39 (Nucleoside phosphatase) family n=1 Tax=Musa troglodytarum TaxID=320322 RepID=A0A9E7HXY8_9LILI|nr:GDA1/CD39 (nucleoside phosphatase) family [Musa troglodytarum]URE42301.1 GDA1/CD39 (nucleoside phosphatase) family [Musa troglodytarum]